MDYTAGVDKKRLEEALTVIVEQLNLLASKPVTADELDRAKDNFHGRLSLMLEDSHSIARWLANDQLELRAIEQPEELLAKIKLVTAQDIQALAKKLFQADNRKLALVGDISEAQKKKLLKIIQ